MIKGWCEPFLSLNIHGTNVIAEKGTLTIYIQYDFYNMIRIKNLKESDFFGIWVPIVRDLVHRIYCGSRDKILYPETEAEFLQKLTGHLHLAKRTRRDVFELLKMMLKELRAQCENVTSIPKKTVIMIKRMAKGLQCIGCKYAEACHTEDPNTQEDNPLTFEILAEILEPCLNREDMNKGVANAARDIETVKFRN